MKKVLYVVLALVAVYLLLCLFGPKQVRVERSIVVNTPPATVNNQLTDFNFFKEKWSPWTEKDPDMKVVIEGVPGQIGHKYSWEGNEKVRKGTMTIKRISPDSILIPMEMNGMRSEIYYDLKPEGKGTNITWGILMNIGFFGRAPMLFMSMDKMMGPDFEHGLQNYKKVTESVPVAAKYKGYAVEETEWNERSFIGKRTVLGWDKMGAFFGEIHPKLWEDLKKMKVEQTMAPGAIFFKWDETNQTSDFAAVAGVPKGTKVKGWENFDLEPSKVLHIAYYGDYSKIMNAHLGMDEYIKEKGMPMQTYVVEEYATDPMAEKDTAKWLTNIYYLFKK